MRRISCGSGRPYGPCQLEAPQLDKAREGCVGTAILRLQAMGRYSELEPLILCNETMDGLAPLAQTRSEGTQRLVGTREGDRLYPPFRLRHDDSCSRLARYAFC